MATSKGKIYKCSCGKMFTGWYDYPFTEDMSTHKCACGETAPLACADPDSYAKDNNTGMMKA